MRRLGPTRTDAEVLGFRLLHDDDGTAWQNWFAAAGLAGYDEAKHLHYNDSSLVLTAALRGRGVALSAPIYVGTDLKDGRLMRIGRTHVIFGDSWLLQAADRGAARRAREAFVAWLESETRRIPSAVGLSSPSRQASFRRPYPPSFNRSARL
jgi:LysR family glycine cleavage system transcriptional activator